MKKEANKDIKCSVESCKYHDDDCNCCTLKEIKVGCDCDGCDCESKDETVCDSFEHDEEKMDE